MSDSLQPHGLQPTGSSVRGDSPGKNTGVGSHSPLQEVFPSQGSNLCLLHCRQILYCLSHQITRVCVCVCVCVYVCVSCLVLSNSCDPMDSSSSPGSSIHGILQARILERVAIPISRESSQCRDQTRVSCIAGRFFTTAAAVALPLSLQGSPGNSIAL